MRLHTLFVTNDKYKLVTPRYHLSFLFQNLCNFGIKIRESFWPRKCASKNLSVKYTSIAVQPPTRLHLILLDFRRLNKLVFSKKKKYKLQFLHFLLQLENLSICTRRKAQKLSSQCLVLCFLKGGFTVDLILMRELKH